jgi:predicted membrane metal-binding protein
MSEHSGFHQVEIGSERNFGLVFAGFFAIVGALPWLVHGHEPRWWAFLAAAAFALVALLAPKVLAPLNKLWFRLGLLLGKVVAPLVMGLVYFIAVTPLAMLARIMGKDFLRTGREARQQPSHWVPRRHDPEHPSSMNNQF